MLRSASLSAEGAKIAGGNKNAGMERRAAEDKVFYEINRNHPLLKSLSNSLSLDQQEQLKSVVRMLESSFPSDLFFSDFAGAPEKLQRPGIEEEQLARMLDDFIDFWGMNDGIEEEQLARMLDDFIDFWGMNDGASEEQEAELLQVDPFSSNKELTVRLLKQKGVR